MIHPGTLAVLDVLDPPETDMEALAFLIATFTDSQLPNAVQHDTLLDWMLGLMPEERCRQLRRGLPHPRLDFPRSVIAAPNTRLVRLKRAVGRRQLRLLVYAGVRVVHRVSPPDLVYRDGHRYLEGYECSIAKLVDRYIMYRFDRIHADTFKILSARLPPPDHLAHSYTLHYLLDPIVTTQRDVALWFPESTVMFCEDGSALVTASVSLASPPMLLHYCEHSHVIETPKLIAMIRESAADSRTLSSRGVPRVSLVHED